MAHPGEEQPRTYTPGEIVNGHILTTDGHWVPLEPHHAIEVKPPFSSTSSWAFGLGIAGVFLADLLLPQVAAITLGIIALTQHSQRKMRGKWMAITGLVLGILYVLVSGLRYLQRVGYSA